MNLDKTTKAKIAAAIVGDIPRQFKGAEGLIEKMISEDIAKFAPAPLATMWADKNLSMYISRNGQNAGYLFVKPRHVADGPYAAIPSQYELNKKTKEAIEIAVAAFVGEKRAIEEMKNKLLGAFAAVRTRKQFVSQFPEFEKYAPQVDAESTMLPALANVMADLSKLGWHVEKAVA